MTGFAPAVCAAWLAAAAPDAASDAGQAPPVEAPGAPEPSVAAAYKAAEGQQGALDGAWRLDDTDGGLLYVFQLSDPGGGGTIEGAWRDPRHVGATDSSGFLASVRRDGEALEIRFARGLFGPLVTLKPTLDGGWAGDLVHNGPRRRVVMRRF